MSKFTIHNGLVADDVNSAIKILTGLEVTPDTGFIILRTTSETIGAGISTKYVQGTGDLDATNQRGEIRFVLRVLSPLEAHCGIFTNSGDSLTEKLRVAPNGNVKIEPGQISGDADAPLEIETETDTGGQAVTIDQNDVDQPFIDFQGTSGADTSSTVSSLTTSGAVQGHLQIEVNGTKRWLAFVADPS